MNKVLFVAPTSGCGGIASWAANYRKIFNNVSEYDLIPIGVSKRRMKDLDSHDGALKRIWEGILDTIDTCREVRSVLKSESNIKVVHVATSGSLGTLRDFLIAKLTKKHGIKSIFHCHYGFVKKDLEHSKLSQLLIKTFELYDSIWVLDSTSLTAIENQKTLKGKASIVPNFLEAPETCEILPKNYTQVAFVGNIDPAKGIFELVDAVNMLANKTKLHIVGSCSDEVMSRLKSKITRDNILLYGRLPNAEAVEFMSKIDILALPTYFESEAFPISILEAMSRGKLVLSCPRAAIPDMLTCEDGSRCGILVNEKNVQEITKGILWAQENKKEADEMCVKANKKFLSSYSSKVLLKLYVSNYNSLLM